jgi:hypothetical protein
MLPEISAVQSATHDGPDAVPARAQVQVAERRWMKPFERDPARA